MRARTWFMLPLVLAIAVVCVRLGFWQLSRLHEKQALNAGLRAAEHAAPLIVGSQPPAAEQARNRTIEATGEFDETRQFLLSGRAYGGVAGVEVVTPLRIEGSDMAILVNRGWLPSGDASTAHPQRNPEPGRLAVRGLAEPLRHGAGGYPIRTIESDSVTLWSARWLDADSIATRLPYAIAGYSLRQYPGPGVPDQPRRSLPHPYNEAMHWSYAIQWFTFAAIIVGGSVLLLFSPRWRNRPRELPEVQS